MRLYKSRAKLREVQYCYPFVAGWPGDVLNRKNDDRALLERDTGNGFDESLARRFVPDDR